MRGPSQPGFTCCLGEWVKGAWGDAPILRDTQQLASESGQSSNSAHGGNNPDPDGKLFQAHLMFGQPPQSRHRPGRAGWMSESVRAVNGDSEPYSRFYSCIYKQQDSKLRECARCVRRLPLLRCRSLSRAAPFSHGCLAILSSVPWHTIKCARLRMPPHHPRDP